MITKSASSYFSGASEVFTGRSVKGFRSAILTVVAGEGDTFTMGAYMTTDGTDPNSSKPRAYMYKDGVKQTGNVTINAAGIYTYVIDFDGATNLRVNGPTASSAPNSVFGLCLKQEAYSTLSNEINTLNSAVNSNIQSLISELQAKSEDIFIPYTFGTWQEVSKFNSAKLIISGITRDTTLTCTANPAISRVGEQMIVLDKTIPLYVGGIAQMSLLASGPSHNEVLDIDLNGVGNIRITETHENAQTLFAYLRLSKNMIDKTPKKIVLENRVPLKINTEGVNSLLLDVNITGITEGQSAWLEVRDASNVRSLTYLIDNKLINSNYTVIPSTGTYKVIVDCKDKPFVHAYLTYATGYNITALPSTDEVDYSVVDKELLTTATNFYYEDLKQIEIEVENVTGGEYVQIKGSNNDFATEAGIPGINLTQNKIYGGTIVLVAGSNKVFANVQEYEKYRVSIFRSKYTYGEQCPRVKITPYKEYKEGLTLPYWGTDRRAFALGYKYLKVNFKENLVVNEETVTSVVKDCSPYLTINISSNLPQITVKNYYDRGLNLLSGSTVPLLSGVPTSGGLIAELSDVISNPCYPVFVPGTSISGYQCSPMFEIEYYTKMPEAEEGLKKIYEKEGYDVYKLPSETQNRDVLNSDIIEWDDTHIYYYRFGYLGIKYTIPFSADNVKNFVEGETINFAYLLPMSGNNDRDGGVPNLYSQLSRIVVFTNSRIFHNFPVRGSGPLPFSDCYLFDESTVFIPASLKKWQPVNDKTKAGALKKYFPVLAEYDYDQFNGRVAGTEGFVDTYGNGGLVTISGRPWLDIPKQGVRYWHRLAYSNMAKGTKWCVFGNYDAAAGSEAVAIATNNGGRTWVVQAYFAGTDYYSLMYGSKIDLKPITDVAGAYVSGSLKMCRRRYNVPTDAVKEPATPFIVDTNEQTLVTSFTVDADGDCLVTLAEDVTYYDDGVYPVVYFENVNANSEWDYICNTGLTADGTTNNGVFFRVKKVSASTYKLFADIGNAYTGDAVCFHIHAVNDCESGFLISTGESYDTGWFEGGFIYHLKQNGKNGSSIYAVGVGTQLIRLCSSPNGVSRACGAYLFSDNADPTLLYVSDEAFEGTKSSSGVYSEKRFASIPGRTVKVPVTPGGVYVGKLSDIDDQSKFKCVCELPLTLTGLVQTHGHFAAQGHQNAICLSKDGFNWEIDVEDDSDINGFDNYGNIYFGNKVAVFK